MAITAAVVENEARRRAAHHDRSQRHLAAGNRGSGSNQSDSARRGPRLTVWAVFALAGLFLLIAVVKTGQVAEGVFLAVLVFVLVGAIAPPVAIVVGLIILAAVLLRGGGVALFNWLGGLTGRQFGPSQAYAPIAPTLPGYAPPTSTSPYAPLGKSVPGG